MLAEEEAATRAKKEKAASKAASKKATKPAGPGAIAAEGEDVAPALSAEPSVKNGGGEPEEIESFAATGIDNALDLIDVVTAKMDKASVGNQAAATIEKHPEVRALVISRGWLLYLTFRHSPSAEAIQGASIFLSVLSYGSLTSPPRLH